MQALGIVSRQQRLLQKEGIWGISPPGTLRPMILR